MYGQHAGGQTDRIGRRPAGFTLIELMVVVAILSLLISILLPAAGSARNVAREIKSASQLRQIMLGYRQYQEDHNGDVLLGNPPANVGGRPVKAFIGEGRVATGNVVAQRYPWRLAGWLNSPWDLLYNYDRNNVDLPTAADSDSDAYLKAYTLSINPDYGLNSIFVGGDAAHDGFKSGQPNRRGHVVFNEAEVRRPAKLIVFTDSRASFRDAGNDNRPRAAFDDPNTGLYRVTPPVAGGRKWEVVNGEFRIVTDELVGLPSGRYTQNTVTAFFDGHVQAMSPDELDDMRLWANWADSEEYDYVNGN